MGTHLNRASRSMYVADLSRGLFHSAGAVLSRGRPKIRDHAPEEPPRTPQGPSRTPRDAPKTLSGTLGNTEDVQKETPRSPRAICRGSWVFRGVLSSLAHSCGILRDPAASQKPRLPESIQTERHPKDPPGRPRTSQRHVQEHHG